MYNLNGSREAILEILEREHEGNRAILEGKWKLVSRYPRGWELCDLEADRTEMNDLAGQQPDMVKKLSAKYENWASRSNVLPWEQVQAKSPKG